MTTEVKLFEKTDERYNLVLPFLLFPLMFLGQFYNWAGTPEGRLLVNLTAAIFLISTLHLGFTLANMIAFPEFQKIIRHKANGEPYKLWLKWLAMYLGLIFIGLIPYNFISTSISETDAPLLQIYFGFYLAACRLHTLMQTKGLLSIYNFKINTLINAGKGSLDFEKINSREVWTIYLLILLCVIQSFLYAFTPRQPGFSISEICFISAGVLLVAFAFFNIRNQAGIERSSKRIYMLRLLYYPITPAMSFALITTEVIHGFEYYFVTKQMRANSKMNSNRLWIIMLVLFCGYISLVWFASGHQAFIKYIYRNDLKNIPSVFFLFSVINIANALMHFYLDSVIFRFREPEINQTIGPMLSTPETMKEASLA